MVTAKLDSFRRLPPAAGGTRMGTHVLVELIPDLFGGGLPVTGRENIQDPPRESPPEVPRPPIGIYITEADRLLCTVEDYLLLRIGKQVKGRMLINVKMVHRRLHKPGIIA